MQVKNTAIDTGGAGFFAGLALVALLFSWTAVSPCLDNGFINWDETRYILNNPRIRSLAPENVRAIFTSRDLEMYSPLSTLSYAVNYHFSGLAPKAYHAADISLHLANTALAMLFVSLLLPGIWPAFLCGLFFGIHPAHVESVAWAAERKDLLYSFFYLLALSAYTLSLKGKKTYFAALCFFLCSLLSKPMAVTLPLALVLIDYLKLETVGRRDWINKLPFFICAAVFSAAMAQPAAAAAAEWVPIARRVVVAFYNLGFYLCTLAWPFNLSAMYVLPLGGAKSIYFFAVGVAAAAGLLWKYCRRNKTLMFGAGFYVAMLLPVLQLIPFGPVISADRYTYLSSLGLFIGVYAAAARCWERAGPLKRKAIVLMIMLTALIFTVAARVRCAVWKDSVSLWSDTLRKQPSSGPALAGLCSAFLRGGMDERAAACLAEAVRRYPEKDDNFFNLGLLMAKKGDLVAARRYFEHTIELNDKHALAHFSLGDIALLRGDPVLAERLYLESVGLDGAFAPALRALGNIAASRKDSVKARQYYERALEAGPSDPKSIELAAALRRQP